MEFDRKKAFLGKPIILTSGLKLYSPTIDEIDELDDRMYYIYIMFSTFNKYEILTKVLEISDEEYEEYQNANSFDILTSDQNIRERICESLSFFTKGKISFDEQSKCFHFDNVKLCDRNDYSKLSQLIKLLNGVTEKDSNEVKFKNEKAKKLFSKLLKLRERNKNADSPTQLDIKDILSILCNAPDNGINIFNVASLTIYQVYEHFERFQLKESNRRYLPLWANGRQLQEGSELPEWILKTNL